MVPTAERAADTRATYAALTRVRGFPSLVGLLATLVLGTSLQMLALSVLVYARTGSALWSATAFGAGFLPQLVGGTLLTSLADRWPARPVLLAGVGLRTAAAVVLATAGLTPAAMLAVVAAVAVVAPVPSAAQSALVVHLVPAPLYVLGRSVFTVTSSAGQLAGLALGGAVVAVLGAPDALWVAAGVQALGACAVAAIPAVPYVRVTAPGRWDVRETWRGNLALLRIPAVRRILLSWWIPSVLLVGAESLVVAYVGERGGPSAPVAWLLAAFPVGAGLGDLVVGRWLSASRQRRAVPWLLTLLGAGLLPLASGPSPVIAAVCFVAASCGLAYQVGWQAAFVRAVPDDRQGLAFGLFGTGMMAGQGLMPVLAGALAGVLGAGATMAVLGVVVLAVSLVLGRPPAADMRQTCSAGCCPRLP